MLGFSESQEYRARVDGEVYVSLMYIAMLRRAPDAPGFAGWVEMLAGGTPRLALIDGFIGSVEYRARFLP